jgi:hypothetical protein
MKNEDIIMLSRRAKDETEDFINEHFENPEKGWPTVRLYSNVFDEQYYEKYNGELQKKQLHQFSQ